MNYKMKLFGVMAFVMALGTFSFMAQAEPTVYVGTEVQHTRFNDVSVGEDSYNAGNVHLGVKFNDLVGVEAGVAKSATETTLGNKLDLTTVNLDAIGYLPVTDSLDVLGTVGATYKVVDGNTVASEKEWGYSVGTGLEYSFTENVSLRGLVRYEASDLKLMDSDSAFKYSAAVNYSF